jgi:hypothetical protein
LNPRAAGATGRWTPEEDTELTSAGANTFKKKDGNDNRIDWTAVTAVAGMTAGSTHSQGAIVSDPPAATADGIHQQERGTAGAVANTPKKKLGNEYKIDWDAVAAQGTGRTKKNSVIADGMMHWIPSSDERVDARVNGQQTKTAS